MTGVDIIIVNNVRLVSETLAAIGHKPGIFSDIEDRDRTVRLVDLLLPRFQDLFLF